MFLIVGLGNPGLKYKNTRHNFGFMTLDELRKQNDLPKFKMNKKLLAEISSGEIGDRKVVLAKPQTYMNESGLVVKAIFNFQFSKNLIIVHDDIELPLGELRISQNISAKGHNGVRSIIQHLGTKDFLRLRLGIQMYEVPPHTLDKFVLGRFSKEEKPLVDKVIKNACLELENLL